MNLDIRSTVQLAFLIAVIGGLLSFLIGIRTIRAGAKLLYFRKRHELVARGWRMIFLAFLMGVFSFILNRFAEPVAYQVFPPSPTITQTPTVSVTPSITLTPTATFTASVTLTPAESYTPQVPSAIEMRFTSLVTPNPESVFSPLQFSEAIDDDFQPVDPDIEFEHPVRTLYAVFSYDKMLEGAQWTAIWYRSDGEIICSETSPWSGSTGGYAYVLCEAPVEQWIAGEYEVQVFLGLTWQVSGRFQILGNPPTPTLTLSPTLTLTPTKTIGPSLTPTVSATPTITMTRAPTFTLTQTVTLAPSATQAPSVTPRPSDTKWPTPES